jgi:phage tail-like protein
MARKPTQEPTFWPIRGRDWRKRTAQSPGLSVSNESGLRLEARGTGPLAFDWPDGSVGGLCLPRGMALDADGGAYLLDLARPWHIRRYNWEAGEFLPLPGVGGAGTEPRLFERPIGLAVLNDNLYVADNGNRRVQVFDRHTLALRHLWGAGYGTPRDIAAGPEFVWVLMEDGRVYRHRPGTDWPGLAFSLGETPDAWRRILVDREGRLYLLRVAGFDTPALHAFTHDGTASEVFEDAGDVRERFVPPPVRLFLNRYAGQSDAHRNGLFCMPAELAGCNPHLPARPPHPENPLGLCLSGGTEASSGARIFHRSGQRAEVDPAELVETPAYLAQGTWISHPLDSERFRCQWHRVILGLDPLPPGTRITISTMSTDVGGSKAEANAVQPSATDLRWRVGFRLAGTLQQPEPTDDLPHDFLVQGQPGRFLWLKVDFESDGFGTPTLRHLEVHYPRQSYLDYLPAVYTAEDESRGFLERFLSIFQTEWEELERRITDFPGLFDPDTVPAGPLLESLAHWLALPLEGNWDAERQRNLLRQVRRFYPHRGTVDGLRRFLQAYLQNITDLAPGEQDPFPIIIEGFRRRDHRFLAHPDAPGPGPAVQHLWSPSVVNRLQTDSHARTGEVQLVSAKDPGLDVFHTYAHRFQVYVPDDWVRTADDEAMVRRALEVEKPAHTTYELCLVPARLRVGVQSTVGLDTVLGDIPVTRLACRDEPDPSDRIHSPRQRLGYDTVLTGRRQSTMPLPFHTTQL